MLAQNQNKNKKSEIAYTGQTIRQKPETSDAGEMGVFYKDNYLISTEPPFVINTIQLVKSGTEQEEKIDEEAIKILEDKNYQAVLTPLSL